MGDLLCGRRAPRTQGIRGGAGKRLESGKPYQRHSFRLYKCLGMWESGLIPALTCQALCHPESDQRGKQSKNIIGRAVGSTRQRYTMRRHE